MRSVAALNGDPVAESRGCWIVVSSDAVIHRLRYPIFHLAALGLNPDLFKNINPEALVPGIRFVILRRDLLKDHRFERCALRRSVKGEGNRASQGKQDCRWSQKCTHVKTAFADLLAAIAELVRASKKAL